MPLSNPCLNCYTLIVGRSLRLRENGLGHQIACPLISVTLCLCLLSSVSRAQVRTWSDATENFKKEAEFLRLEDGVVHLKTIDGKTLRVPFEKLSAADQKYVRDSSTNGDRSPQASQPKQPRPADMADREVDTVLGDERNFWASPYFLVRQREMDKFWLLTFNPRLPDCAARCPLLLIESSRNPVAITLESTGKAFRINLLANQAIITCPGSDKTVPEGKYGGLWRADYKNLSPTERIWHPKGEGEVRGVLRLPTTVGGEDLLKQLCDPEALGSLAIPIGSDGRYEVALKDLPADERAAAVYDLALANAPRWLKTRFGAVFHYGDQGLLYEIDVGAANSLLSAIPAEWRRVIEASKEHAGHFAVLHQALNRAVQENKATQDTIRNALQKHPVLKQPVENLDVESLAMLSETVSTKFDDRLVKPALNLLMGQSDRFDKLDAAVGDNRPRAVLDIWIRLSPEEKDAILALATRTLLGRLRCPHSKLTHVELLCRVCEIIAESGPNLCDELDQKRKDEIDKLLHEQLRAAAGNK